MRPGNKLILILSFYLLFFNISFAEEKITTTYNLPIKSEFLPLAENNMNISISSGTIPRGMNLSGYSLVGTPYEVNKDTKYTFVVRAEQNGVIDERTFSIIVTGPDEPVWTTKEDLLPFLFIN